MEEKFVRRGFFFETFWANSSGGFEGPETFFGICSPLFISPLPHLISSLLFSSLDLLFTCLASSLVFSRLSSFIFSSHVLLLLLSFLVSPLSSSLHMSSFFSCLFSSLLSHVSSHVMLLLLSCLVSLSLSLSVSVSICLCCVVCVVSPCVRSKTPPCVRPKRLRV